jgi:hypothetical protein
VCEGEQYLNGIQVICLIILEWFRRGPEHTSVMIMMIGMLLVSRSGLVEEDVVKVFHYQGFHLSFSFLI